MLQTIQREGKRRAGWKTQGGKNAVCLISVPMNVELVVGKGTLFQKDSKWVFYKKLCERSDCSSC